MGKKVAMNRTLVIVLGLMTLLSSLSVKTALADISLASTDVAYTASRSVSYSGPLTQISFSTTVTLECVVAYNCLTEGSLSSSSTCHLNATPSSALLTVDYNIKRYLRQDLVNTTQIQLPPEQLAGLVGNSPPINIPIDGAGTITIVIHGRLLGQNLTVTPQGSANPNAVQWSNWTQQDTNVSSTNSQVTLKMDTEYDVSVTVTVTLVGGFDVVTRDSSAGQFTGNTSPTFVIPEFPSFLILPLFMVTILLVAFYKRKHFI